MTLSVNLAGYRGTVNKSATVYCNDPQTPRVSLSVSAKVVPFVDIRPSDTVVFRGPAAALKPQDLEVESTKTPMHILRVESDLKKEVSVKVEPLAEGARYRVVVTNQAERGTYSGFIRLVTDHPQKPEVLISVRGMVEGPIGIRPTSLLVGKVKGDMANRVGRVLVVSHTGAAFRITKVDYDRELLDVVATPQEAPPGYVLDVSAKLEAVPAGSRKRTTLKVQTDAQPEEWLAVEVFVVSP
ncbi:MAG: hypothetical protein WHS86_04395 [Desulfosoma sp.]